MQVLSIPRLRSTRSTAALVLLFLGAALACDREGPVEVLPPPDTAAPAVRVLFPAGDAYDENGNALVDLRVEWNDDVRVDPGSVRVHALRAGTGGATTSANLVDVWEVIRLDSAGLHLEETIDALLPQGGNYLVISVRDTSGNEAADTVLFQLPYAAVTKTIDTGSTGRNITKAMYCPDDNRIYVAAWQHVVVVDPDSLRIVGSFQVKSDIAKQVLCVPGDPSLYVSGAGVMLHDRISYVNTADIAGAWTSNAVIASRADADLIYVGHDRTADVGVISRSQQRRIYTIPMGFSTAEWLDFVSAIAVMPGDQKIYINRPLEGGILVIDPATGALRKRIDLTGPASEWAGEAGQFALSPDDRYLYSTVVHGVPRGLYRIDTASDEIAGTLPLSGRAQDLGISADGRRAFVTTQDLNTGARSRNALVDLQGWRVLQEFERPKVREFRWDAGVVFHPTRPIFFAGRDLEIDVYLNRR